MIFRQSSPHPALQKYIGQYLYFSFNTNMLPSLKQTFLPYDIPAISFFIDSEFFEHDRNHLISETSIMQQPTFAYYNALITHPFTMHFKENAMLQAFMIPFKPVGFSSLFHKDAAELTNLLPDFSLLAGPSAANRLLEQLAETNDFATQVKFLDDFFLKKISHSRNTTEQIGEACRKLIVTDGLINMKELAYHTNMSLKTLERKFTEQVGVQPKLYARFKRFHHALSLMNSAKRKSWTDITYNCGFYDQAHFIKEFKAFTNCSPSEYCAAEYTLYNQFILYRNFTAF